MNQTAPGGSIVVVITDLEMIEPKQLIFKDAKLIPCYPPKWYTIHVNLLPNEKENIAYERVQIIFKLFKEGAINFLGYLNDHSEFLNRKPYQVYWRRPPNRIQYVIRQNEEKSFVSFWNSFREISTVDFAIYRFHQADFKFQYPDRFLDYVLSIESLMIPDGKGQKSAQFVKGAYILSKMDKSLNRKYLTHYLGNVYEKRGSIVHGSVTLDAPCNLSDEEKQQIKLEYEKDGPDAVENFELSASWEKCVIPLRCCNRNLIKCFYLEGLIGKVQERKDFIKSITNKKHPKNK